MKIVDNSTLKRFREMQRCHRCTRFCRNGCEPHHVILRGSGGGNRMDIQLNLLALCMDCHRAVHNGQLSQDEMFGILARRERIAKEDVEVVLNWIKRAPTNPMKFEWIDLGKDLSPVQKKIITHQVGENRGLSFEEDN